MSLIRQKYRDSSFLNRKRKNKNAAMKFIAAFCFLAEWTGLEPATPGVTGRYSNQLNYRSFGDPTGIRTPVLTVKG